MYLRICLFWLWDGRFSIGIFETTLGFEPKIWVSDITIIIGQPPALALLLVFYGLSIIMFESALKKEH